MSSQQITKFIFWPLELAVVLLIFVNAYFIFNTSYDKAWFYKYGMMLGLIAFGLFTLVLFPGMLMRYGFKGKLVQTLVMYRRELGKLMFLFATAHYLTIQVFPMMQVQELRTFLLPQIMGFIALALALPLFITSTNWAQKKLGKWWKKLHSLVYIIVWFVFFHVALAQGLTIVSFSIFLVAVAELMSLINYHLIRLNLDHK